MNYKQIEPIWNSYLENKSSEDYLTLYIHIPYCMQSCSYCMHYRKEVKSNDEISDYFSSLREEIEYFSFLLKNEQIKSIAIGGGAPSIFELSQLESLNSTLINSFNLEVSNDNMFSIEACPGTLTLDKVDFLSNESIFNRLSMGIQTFNTSILSANKRINIPIEKMTHLIGYITSSLRDKNYKFNVDLMIGLLKQELKHVIQDISLLRDLKVPMITLYSYQKKRIATESDLFYSKIKESVNQIRQEFKDDFIFSDSENNLDCLKMANKRYLRDDIDVSNIYHHFFKHHYNTVPDNNNNCLGIGEGSVSWAIESNSLYINKGEHYHIINESEKKYKSIFDHFTLRRKHD